MTEERKPKDKFPGVKPTPRRSARRHADGEVQTRKIAIEAARLCHDRHCGDILLLDTRGLSEVTDFVLIASGTSDRQIKAVGGEVAELAAKMGTQRFGTERDEASKWLVLDFVDLVVHLFEPATRAHYDLEMMWADAPRVTWRRRAAAKRKPASE